MVRRACVTILAVIGGVTVLGLIILFVFGLVRIISEPSLSSEPSPSGEIAASPRAAKPINTSTPTADQIKALAKNVPYDLLARNTEEYIGDIVYYRGQVVQVSEVRGLKVILRVNVTEKQYGLWDDTVWVNYEGPRVLENDIVHIWGKVMGRRTYTAVLGNQVTIPEIQALILENEAAWPTSTPGIGSRSLPALLGQAITVVGDKNKVYALAVTQVYRGEEAWTYIQAANSFNSPPPEGMEYILVWVEVIYMEGPADEPLNMDEYEVKAVSHNQFIKSVSVVEPEPEFDVSLFPGAHGGGWVALAIYKDDPDPLIVIGADYEGRGGSYFAIHP